MRQAHSKPYSGPTVPPAARPAAVVSHPPGRVAQRLCFAAPAASYGPRVSCRIDERGSCRIDEVDPGGRDPAGRDPGGRDPAGR